MMQTFIQKFRELPFKTHILIAFGLSLLVVVLIVLIKSFLPPEVPLFYGRPVGETQLTKTLGLTIAPGISIMILILNSFLSILTTNMFVKKILITSALVASLLTAITVVRIIFLVGFF